MVHMIDAVQHGVSHVKVAAGQVDFGTQSHSAIGKFPRPHPGKQVQTLFNGTVPVGALGGHPNAAPILLKLLGRQLTDIGKTLFNESHRLTIVLLKVVRTVEKAIPPVEAKPVNVLLNGIHKLGILLGGVGIVHPEVAQTSELFGSAEVDGQGLAVTDVQVAVRLRRKTCMDGHALELSAGSNVLFNKCMDKVPALGHFLLHGFDLISHGCQSFLCKF